MWILNIVKKFTYIFNCVTVSDSFLTQSPSKSARFKFEFRPYSKFRHEISNRNGEYVMIHLDFSSFSERILEKPTHFSNGSIFPDSMIPLTVSSSSNSVSFSTLFMNLIALRLVLKMGHIAADLSRIFSCPSPC